MSFKDFGLTSKTLQGLEMAKLEKPTSIQTKSLPFSLEGRDILGAAQTGSGKTLCFLIPILELLHKSDWSSLDGMGALIISPTRELAIQIFNVLRSIGKKHTFSAGLLIGGKDYQQEKERIGRMNILVATPGRLLQHMDQSSEFNTNNIMMLVIDEADRILDAGFEETMTAILEHLPKKRQTLLFSATQTKAVKDLARLSVKDAEYVSTHLEITTPAALTQHYIFCPLHQKLDLLYSFIKSHLKSKIVVFIASGKQARYIFAAFCKLQPGMPLLLLHGKQSQQKRIATFEQFKRQSESVLFATDLAARGLDIPGIDWVVQLDCPDDTDAYIHRVGRTARNGKKGQGLLVLMESEAKMVEALDDRHIPIKQIKMNPSKNQKIQGLLMGFCSESPELKFLAQNSFVTYLKSVFLQHNKEIFNVHSLPKELYAESLGLPGAPNVTFKKGGKKDRQRDLDNLDNKIDMPVQLKGRKKPIEIAKGHSSDEEVIEEEKSAKMNKIKGAKMNKIDKMFAKKNSTVLSTQYIAMKKEDSESDSELLTLTRKDHDVSDSEVIQNSKKLSKLKKALLDVGKGKRIEFNDDGVAFDPYTMETVGQFNNGDVEQKQAEYLKRGQELMQEVDVDDKLRDKERRKKIKRDRKEREKEVMDLE